MTFASELRLWDELLRKTCTGLTLYLALHIQIVLKVTRRLTYLEHPRETTYENTTVSHRGITTRYHHLLNCSFANQTPHATRLFWNIPPSRQLIYFLSRGSELVWLLMCPFSCSRRTPRCCQPVSLALFLEPSTPTVQISLVYLSL